MAVTFRAGGKITVHLIDFSLPFSDLGEEKNTENLAVKIARDEYHPTVMVLAVAAGVASRFSQMVANGEIFELYQESGKAKDPLLRLWRRQVAPHSPFLLFPLVQKGRIGKKVFFAPGTSLEEDLALLSMYVNLTLDKRGGDPIFPSTLKELLEEGSIQSMPMASGVMAYTF